jgi:hypothetical protein
MYARYRAVDSGVQIPRFNLSLPLVAVLTPSQTIVRRASSRSAALLGAGELDASACVCVSDSFAESSGVCSPPVSGVAPFSFSSSSESSRTSWLHLVPQSCQYCSRLPGIVSVRLKGNIAFDGLRAVLPGVRGL